MMLVKNIVLVLQKSKQAKTRADFKGKRDGSKIGIVSFVAYVIRILNPRARKFRAASIVGHDSSRPKGWLSHAHCH